jgi:TonB family protein
MNRATRLVTATSVLLVVFGATAAGQDSLSTARELYAGAAYEDALLLLNRLRSAGPGAGETASAIERYRAFCLLALGRSADAEQAIAAVVEAEPLYQPSNADLSPRVRSAFTDVRKRMLPSIVQEKYVAAKSAYDRKEWPQAEHGFKEVLDVLADPDLGAAAGQQPLSDLKTLATGFYDLSAAAAAPPPPPPPLPVPVAPPPAPVSVVAGPPRIYVAGDPGVIPPIAIRQFLPAYATQNPSGFGPSQGSLEVVIGENGGVESAAMKEPITNAYDRAALAAAKTWSYKPAMLNGKPVKFRKTVQIVVKR